MNLANSILAAVALLLQAATVAALVPVVLAVHAWAAARATGRPASGPAAMARDAWRQWRGTSFAAEGAAAIATLAPMLACAAALAAAAVVPGLCRGLPTAPLAAPLTIATLLLLAEVAPVLGALAIGRTVPDAAGAAGDAVVGFAAVLLLSPGAGLLDGTEVPGPARMALVLAAVLVGARAADALRPAPALLAELGGPDLTLARAAAGLRAVVLLTLARDLSLPWLGVTLPDADSLPLWGPAWLGWVGAVALAAAGCGVAHGRMPPATREAARGRRWATLTLAAVAGATLLLSEATP